MSPLPPAYCGASCGSPVKPVLCCLPVGHRGDHVLIDRDTLVAWVKGVTGWGA